MTYRLGVDVGTTFTAAAVANGAAPSMLGLGNRALQVPSVLYLAAGGDFLVGEAAERRGMSEPGRLVREFKRRIGDPVPLLVAGIPFSPEMLTAELLRWVVRTAADRMGEQPTETIVTHPANWGPYKLEQLDQILTLADIGSSRKCAEPVAAAAQYAARIRVDPGDRLAVYDLGGGTFDACVLEQTREGFRLLGTPEGIDHLGGVDFDEALLGQVVTGLGHPIEELDLADPAVTVGLARLRRDVVEAKEALSSDLSATVAVALPGLSTTIRITRKELETLIRPSLRATVDALGRALRSAGLTATQLRAIVLVGGSSRIPLVRDLLEREFGVPVAIDTHPKHDVALGATQIRPEGAPLAERAALAPTRLEPPSATTPAPPSSGSTSLAAAPPKPGQRTAMASAAMSPSSMLPARTPPTAPKAAADEADGATPPATAGARKRRIPPRWPILAGVGAVIAGIVMGGIVVQTRGDRDSGAATAEPAPTPPSLTPTLPSLTPTPPSLTPTLSVRPSPTPNAPAILVNEHFAAGKLPPGWIPVLGNWKVVDGRLQATTDDARARITFGPKSPKNFRIDTMVRFVKVADATRWLNIGLDYHVTRDWGAVLVVRSDTTVSNGLELAQKRKEMKASDLYVSDPVDKAPMAVGVGQDHSLSVEVRGRKLRVTLDGQGVFSAANMARTGGNLGFVINNATVQFDNVKVTLLDA